MGAMDIMVIASLLILSQMGLQGEICELRFYCTLIYYIIDP